MIDRSWLLSDVRLGTLGVLVSLGAVLLSIRIGGAEHRNELFNVRTVEGADYGAFDTS